MLCVRRRKTRDLMCMAMGANLYLNNVMVFITWEFRFFIMELICVDDRVDDRELSELIYHIQNNTMPGHWGANNGINWGGTCDEGVDGISELQVEWGEIRIGSTMFDPYGQRG